MRFIAGLVLALVIATVAGCGSSGPAGPTTARAPSSPVAAAYGYARCMRSHGVTGFPDPHVSVSPGRTSISQVAPASAGSAPQFKTAEHACAGLMPAPGRRAGHEGPGAAVLLAFARCLRTHGLSGFPDPDRDGRITSQMITAAGINVRTPVFLSAARACIGVTHGAITAADVLAVGKGPH